MFGIIKFLIKIILLLVVLIIITQLEYKGRKIETYIKEFIYSYRLDELANEIKETVTKKTVEKIKKGLDTDNLKNAMEKIKDDERKEMQELIDE